MRFFVYIFALLLVAGSATLARAEDLASLYRQILANPGNTELNLRYARLAEENGELRWALQAYERVVANDPKNAEGQAGYQRLQMKITPNTTAWTMQLAGIYESNPRYVPSGASGEAQMLGALSVRDDRSFGDYRWRTNAGVIGLLHSSEQDLNYGYLGATTGPVFPFFAGSTIHTAFGGGAAVFDNHFYYSEALAVATIERTIGSAVTSVTFRGGYRDYGEFFPTTNGFYADIRARFAAPITSDTAVIFSPWVRWSGINGTAGDNIFLTEVQPEAYTEVGARVEFYRTLTTFMAAGPTLTAFGRWYRNDLTPDLTEKRFDPVYAPGFVLLFPGIFGLQTSLKIDYQYIRDQSNIDQQKFSDHVVTSSFVTRF